MNIQDVTQLAANSLDVNRDGSIELDELSDFLNTLQDMLVEEANGTDIEGLSHPSSGVSALASLASSDNPGHDLKVLLNDTLVDVAKELGLTMTTIPGANYPAVAELAPGPGGSLTSTQADLRRQITQLVVERMQNDPALPKDVSIRVENLDAGSGADRIAFGRSSGKELVFDVITGKGILKSRIAKNYLAEQSGQSVEQAHSRQYELLGNIASRLAHGAEAYRRLAPSLATGTTE